MNQLNLRNDQFVGIPFYIFFSLLLGVLAVLGAQAVFRASSSVVTAVYVGLFALHIGLYWVNLNLHRNLRWQVLYYSAQALLIIGLANFPHATKINITILSTMSVCIIGEVLGLWGNSRKAFLLGAFYLALVLSMFFLLLERGDLFLSISSLLINGGFIILFLIVLNQQLIERQKAVDLAESLESANAKLAALNARIETLTLQSERQRMARELHDTLAQGVAGLVLQLEAVKAHLASARTERAAAIVEKAIVRARDTLAESRAAIDDLRAVPANLSEAIHERIERFKQATGLPCQAVVSVTDNQLAPATTDHALHILGESLTNVARHAQATQVNVKFMVQGQSMHLEVRDNGVGFDVQHSASGHYGLLGMHERARLTGGTLVVASGASGTSVQFIVGEV